MPAALRNRPRAAPLCHTAVLSAFRAKEYILVLADSLQSCYHKMLLKNPRVTLISTWCSRCHCPLCLPRTLHCQTSPRWSGSGTWNIQFYHLKILTKIWVVQLPGVPLPWLCKALRGKAARQENHWDHQTNFYHHAEEKATTYSLLQQTLTSGQWPPHPMFLFLG